LATSFHTHGPLFHVKKTSKTYLKHPPLAPLFPSAYHTTPYIIIHDALLAFQAEKLKARRIMLAQLKICKVDSNIIKINYYLLFDVSRFVLAEAKLQCKDKNLKN